MRRKCSSTAENLEVRTMFSAPERVINTDAMMVGINLDTVSDYGAATFVDAFKQSRTWMTRNAVGDSPWDTGQVDHMATNAGGWPLQVPFTSVDTGLPQMVHTIVPIHGTGIYTLHIKGAGTVKITADHGMIDPNSQFLNSLTFTSTGGESEFQVPIYASQFGNGIGIAYVELQQSNVANPVVDINLVMPGHNATYKTQPFLPSWTDKLDSFNNLRYMVWGGTNGSPLTTWASRPTINSQTQAGIKGVALEYMVMLSNQLHKDAWITLPAGADDDYVRQTAAYLRDHLDPTLKVYVEYSNETWNPIFTQTNYVQDRGQALGLDADRWNAGQKYVTYRSAEIWNIFSGEYTGASSNRFIKVLPGMAAFAGITASRVAALSDPISNPTGVMPDAVAIAPYFGNGIADEIVAQGLVNSITPDQIIDRALAEIRSSLAQMVTSNKFWSDQVGAALITYEGGPHIVATGNNVNIDTLTNKLIAANRSPRMGDLMTEYLDIINTAGITLHEHFSYTGPFSKWGSWGLIEDQDAPLTAAYKFNAITNWMEAHPFTSEKPVARAGADIFVLEDSEGRATVTLNGTASRDIDGTLVSYIWKDSDGLVIATGATAPITLALGRHEIELLITDNNGFTKSDFMSVTVAPAAAVERLVDSSFTGTNPTGVATSHLDSNATFSGWSRGSGLTPLTVPDSFGFVGNYGNVAITTLQDAVSTNKYLSTTVAPKSGYTLDLRGATFSFSTNRLDENTPRRYVVMSSIDGFTKVLFDSGHADTMGVRSFSFNLPFDGFKTDESVEFRIYAFEGLFFQHRSALTGFSLNGQAIANRVPALDTRVLNATRLNVFSTTRVPSLFPATNSLLSLETVVRGVKKLF